MELTDNEKTALEIFTSEAGAYLVVQKIATEFISKQRDLFIRNGLLRKGLSNDEVGAKLRAFDEGISLVEGIFHEIGQHKKPTASAVERNPAR